MYTHGRNLVESLVPTSYLDIPSPSRATSRWPIYSHFCNGTWSLPFQRPSRSLRPQERAEAVSGKTSLGKSSQSVLTSLLTLARLNVELVAPCSVLQTVDHDLIEPCGRISPVFPWAVIFYCCCIGPRVHPLYSGPIEHSKVIVLHGEGWQGAVDGWKEKDNEESVKLLVMISYVCRSA